MLGAFTKRMLAWGEDHIKGQIARRDPHLVVFTYGGNDLRRFATGKLDVAQYTDEFAESIERVLAGKPDAACLVVGISDRGRTWTHEVEAEHMANVTESHRQAAARAGCAFFDTYAAMGGVGSAKRWRAKDPPLAAGDLKHLTHAGNVVLGGWIYDAIVHEYVRHRLAAPGSTPEG
jgi:lysophospholipase L1-like esterase